MQSTPVCCNGRVLLDDVEADGQTLYTYKHSGYLRLCFMGELYCYHLALDLPPNPLLARLLSYAGERYMPHEKYCRHSQD